MRILFVVHGLPPEANAGTENYTWLLARTLAAHDDVAIFHRRADPESPEYDLHTGEKDGVTLFGLNNTHQNVGTYESAYANPRIDELFAKTARRFGAQVVHIQHLENLSLGIPARAKAIGLPVAMTLHDYWLLCPTGQFVKPDAAPCAAPDDTACAACLGPQLTATRATRRAHALAGRHASPAGPVMKTLAFLNRFRRGRRGETAVRKRQQYALQISHSIDRFFSPSRYLKERMSAILDPKRIAVSELGYAYDGCNAPRVPGNKVRFGFLGSVVPWKGPHTLLEAYRQVGIDRCDVHLHGGIVPVPARPAYPEQIRKLLAETPALATGRYDQADVYDLLARIDVLVVPSTSAENSPLTIHEARAAKVPVIASRIGGIPEFVRDGETGLLVPPGDAAALAEAMRRFVDEPGLIEKMRGKIVAPRSIEDDAAAHRAFYRELIP